MSALISYEQRDAHKKCTMGECGGGEGLSEEAPSALAFPAGAAFNPGLESRVYWCSQPSCMLEAAARSVFVLRGATGRWVSQGRALMPRAHCCLLWLARLSTRAARPKGAPQRKTLLPL